jgi:hypothetical protein
MAIANITNNILTDSGVATSSLLTTSAAASTYQTILTNPVTGTGTTNYLPKFTGASTIGNSSISDVAASPLSIVKDASSSTSNLIFISPTTGTNASILNLDNAGAGSFYIGRQNSAGASVLLSGLGAYASVVGHTGSQTLHLVTNAISRVQIDGTGITTFTGAISGTSATFSSTGSFGNASLNGAYLVVKGANGVPASSGTTTTAVFRISSGTGLYNVLDFGTNESLDYSWIQSTRANSLGTYDYLAIQPNGGNLLVGTLTNSTYKLDVNGTGRFVKSSDQIVKIETTSATDNARLDFITPSKSYTIQNLQTGAANALIFYDLSASAERMRITSGGALCLGVTSAYGTNLLNINGGIYATSSVAAVVAADLDMMVFQNTGATYSKACLVASMTATGGTGSYFFYGQQSTSTAAIKIFSNGNIQNTNNSYGAISDARLKENIKDATPKLDDLMKVKVRNYNLKGESNKQLGVISQELEAIFPNMIEESTNMGENMKIKGVKYSVFVPMLIKAVQELKAEIEILKNK